MTILHIDSSVTGQNSVSRVLTQHVINRLTGESGAEVIHRDLVAEPLDHMTLDVFADRSVLDEFLSADTVVIGAPMYNFTLPSQLKAWLDRILVSGKTFRYTEDGPEGLAGGKRVIVALSRGGFYRGDAPAAVLEHLETYLSGVFGFIGITPEFVAADGINLGPDFRAKAVETAIGEVERLAA